jgi:hypothetical protein
MRDLLETLAVILIILIFWVLRRGPEGVGTDIGVAIAAFRKAVGRG